MLVRNHHTNLIRMLLSFLLLLLCYPSHAITWKDRGGEAILSVLGERLPLWLGLPYIDSYAQIQTQSCLTLKKRCGV